MAAALQARSEYEIYNAARQRSVASIDALNRQIAALEDQSRALLTTYESGSGNYAPIIDSEIAILKLRAEIVSELADRPFGMRDFRVMDPSGNRIAFGEAVRGESGG